MLRQPRLSDADPMFRGWTQDPEVTRYLTWRPHTSVADTEAFLAAAVDAWKSDTRAPYVITLRDRDTPIGAFEVRLHAPHAVEIGYVLRRADWGKGYVTEIARAALDHVFAIPGVWRVIAYCDVENAASAHVLEKVGMQREGVLRRFIIHPNLSAQPRDAYLYARVRQAAPDSST